MRPTRFLLFGLMWSAACLAAHAGSREPFPWKVPPAGPDALELPAPAAVRLEGFLGLRVANNEANRLLKVDLAPLLAGYQQRPGSHPWIGEHIGKWLHASVLAWSYTGDEALRQKLDAAVRELVKCQEPDGYLGTYTRDKRFGLFEGADWDVWSHKYNLLGLLTYYQYTHDEAALSACRGMGDLLVRTFGPGRKSILSAGTHRGMAATSVLEPMVLLYRATGEPRYLEFCRYLVRSWDEPGGPAIETALLREHSVQKTANAKAYEMLSNLVGLCELARATGERQLLQPALIAWEDIVANRLYVTGGASQAEHFRDDHYLPNQPSANISETCVTTTWIQFNSQLLRLTGEARFGDELERTFFNHLAAAQRPDGAEWCYFTALEGTKPYGPGINCCVSSGPRGMALVPAHAFLRQPAPPGGADGVLVNLLESARVGVTLDSQEVILEQVADHTQPGTLTLTVHTERPARFALGVRTPNWALPLRLRSAKGGEAAQTERGWTRLPARLWSEGDRVEVRYTLSGRVIPGTFGNAGQVALAWGPAILAYDEAFNGQLGSYKQVGLAPVTAGQSPVQLRSFPDGGAVFLAPLRSAGTDAVQSGTFVLFADAGSEGSRYRVWLPGPSTPLPQRDTNSVFQGAREGRSREGNVAGTITDGDGESFVVTFDGKPQVEAWFAVQSDAAQDVRRVVFAHGRSFHDGGWFNAAAGKPRIEMQRQRNGPWEALAVLESYPNTTATGDAGLTDGQRFECVLPVSTRTFGLRVIGAPASGDNPSQAFASCAELQGLAR